MTALSLTDVVADYGDLRVLGPLSLDVVRGQTVALVGKSGAGKSTLLSLMYQQWRPLGAALMPQDLGLVPALSVFHNVYMGGLKRHSTTHNLLSLLRPFKRDIEQIRPILETLDIDHKCWTATGELSGGQRQRVAAARVIHQKGEILLADEPASALDGPMVERVLAALTDAYPTSVLAMHDVELALHFADRVVGIADGGIALDEPRDRLQASDLLTLY
ncbi:MULTISPECIES: ATP-binding cassette domain-containing protein [unclassified Marinimicrobium]|jgi:phosphonate transport system ATP-binding protein|uniref:ATP-binding cassette domain-containing protein n=1 Tax=Marinimicrobium TaxID=359337 RepID=UPI000C538542|nr:MULTISPECIES: ATP-binding cassette domain-containing protein [unclassified Marinimicrobium]MAN50523.1 ABC transporter [Marinimicrobium sp.]